MCNKVEDMMPAWKTNIQVSRLLLEKGDHEKGGPGLPSPTATTTAEKKLPVKNSQGRFERSNHGAACKSARDEPAYCII